MKPSLSQVPLIGADVVPDEPSPDVVDAVVVVVVVVVVELCCVVVPSHPQLTQFINAAALKMIKFDSPVDVDDDDVLDSPDPPEDDKQVLLPDG